MTGRYVGSTFVEDQREFVEHLQNGKKSVNYWTCQKVPRPRNHLLCDGGHLIVKKVDFFDYARNEAMLVLVFYIFQKNVSL